MTDKIAKLGIACSMWHTSMNAFYRKYPDRFSFGEQNNSKVKSWELYLDKNVSMTEHCKAKSSYMIDMEIANNDMTHMCWCKELSGAYIAGQILVEEGLAETYEIIYDEAAYWSEKHQKDIFDLDRDSVDYVKAWIHSDQNHAVLWLHLTQEGADFFRYSNLARDRTPKGMDELS